MLRRLRFVPLALLVVGVAAGLLVAAAPWSTPVAAVGGLPIADYTGPVPTFSVPLGYHLTYRVSTPPTPTFTEDLWVERPFDSFDQTRSGPPPGAGHYLTTVTRLGQQVLSANGTQASLVYVPAAPAGEDVRIDAMIGPALRSGLILLAGHSRVIGRSCTVVRSSGSLRAVGPLAKLRAGSSYVDTCIDGDGIVLSEATYRAGRLTELRQAVSLALGAPAAASADFALPGEAAAFYSGGGSFTPLTLSSSPPGVSWSASWLPAGFRHAGRYAVVPSQPQAFDNSSGAPPPGPATLGLPSSLVTELDDTYVSGPDLIVVQQGLQMGGGRFNPPTGGQPVTVGSLGPGQLVISALASVVTAEPAHGTRFVRVSGTVPPAVLLQVARSLRVEAPGQIVPLHS